MNAPLPRGWGCIQAETGSPTALHINEWCTADKMQINLSSGQQAHSRKKPCSLLEAHHPPYLHSPNACHFFKKISNRGLTSAKKPLSYRGGTLTFPSSYQMIFSEDRISSKDLDMRRNFISLLIHFKGCLQNIPSKADWEHLCLFSSIWKVDGSFKICNFVIMNILKTKKIFRVHWVYIHDIIYPYQEVSLTMFQEKFSFAVFLDNSALSGSSGPTHYKTAHLFDSKF